jgi:putative transposase
MHAENVQRSVETAMVKTNLAKHQRPKLLSDNGACYIASELKEYLKSVGVKQVHGKLNHPQTGGKIERYLCSMKNVVKLDNYYCPEELTSALDKFVLYYNYQHYHESLDNVTPADVYYGRRKQILKRRERLKKQSMTKRRELYLIEKLKI